LKNKHQQRVSVKKHDVSGDYKPLIIVLIFCVILASNRTPASHSFMYPFMGYFFVFLSLFKMFDLEGFVEGFATYDLITKRTRVYGYVYPFIELFLGLAYLAQFALFFTNWLTLVVMTISGIGVISGIISDHKVKCACLGTAFNIPLSTVSIVENFGMGAMAAYKLIVFSH
jgi:hypothetical protein